MSGRAALPRRAARESWPGRRGARAHCAGRLGSRRPVNVCRMGSARAARVPLSALRRLPRLAPPRVAWPPPSLRPLASLHPSDFTNVSITFVCNCLVVYFCVVLPMNALVERAKAHPAGKEAPAAAPDSRECPE